ncbi:hypothetical protein BGX28_003403 [Mortierella sp. GBA30]|nr:hypothetical protein BGX28_003403 [Mortierella sp. GBA30]
MEISRIEGDTALDSGYGALDDLDELDEGGAALGNEYTGEDVERVKSRMPEHEATLSRHVHDTVRDALLYDPYILERWRRTIQQEQRITWDEKGQLIFYLKTSSLDDWKTRHQFVWVPISLHMADPKPTRPTGAKEKKGAVPGAKSGKTRLRAPLMNCHCPSNFNAIYRPVATSDGMPGITYRIEYNPQYNHHTGDKNNIGTQHESRVMTERIKAMTVQGTPINTIMDRLTMDFASFPVFLRVQTASDSLGISL